jgi:PKD repeat protein
MLQFIRQGLLVILLFSFFNSPAQVKENWCDIDAEDKKLVEKDPQILVRRQILEEFTQDFIQNTKDDTDTLIIPVVFHVLHNYGPENISKEQIEREIEILNRNYRRLRTDYDEVHPNFQDLNVDGYIEFRLAQLDPNGNPTDGIRRYQTDLTYNATNDLKLVIRGWPSNRYLNIWTVASIESGAAAWSHLPGIGPLYDGVVSLHNYVGDMGTGMVSRSRTVTHEIGHYLNLLHPWGAGNDPGLASNCDIDDYVDDTPLTIGHTSCNINAESCGSLDNVQNYMDYSYCSVDIFTAGQIARMRAALNSIVSGRSNLWTPENHLQTGISEGQSIGAAVPVADFYLESRYSCTLEDVSFQDLSWNINTDVDYKWILPGSVDGEYYDQNPVVQYNQQGQFDVTLIVTSDAGSDTLVRSEYISVTNVDLGRDVPHVEYFETDDFIQNDENPEFQWKLFADGNADWELYSINDSTRALRMDNYVNDPFTTNEIVTPNMNFSSDIDSLLLYVKYAYAQKSGDSNDKFTIYVSTDCGVTWEIKKIASGATLRTSSFQTVGGDFIPTANEWGEFEIKLNSYIEDENILLKYELISNQGNYFYLGGMRLDTTASLITEDPSGIVSDYNSPAYINIFPNPFTDQAIIQIKEMAGHNGTLSVYDVTGKRIQELKIDQQSGFEIQLSDLLKNPSSGLYILHYKSDRLDIIKKIVCN